jgi:hypothetical protein
VEIADQAIGRTEATQGQSSVMIGDNLGPGVESPSIVINEEWTPVTKGNHPLRISSDPGSDHKPGRFWALEDELEDEEEEILTLTIEDIIAAASRVGLSVEELMQAEAELQEEDKVPDITDVHCPRAGKIFRAITRGRSLKHQLKPWSDPLPKQ